MSLIGSVGGIYSSPLNKLATATTRTDGLGAPGALGLPGMTGLDKTQQGTGNGFGQVFDSLIQTVDIKQREAQESTRSVLLGKSDNLHGSMIAMQEAGVAFQMMVEVRNKVVESYQELMRMPV